MTITIPTDLAAALWGLLTVIIAIATVYLRIELGRLDAKLNDHVNILHAALDTSETGPPHAE